MVTVAQVMLARKLALALPDAEEGSHMGHADFRVRGKIFAGLSKDEKLVTLKLTPEIQASLGGLSVDDPFFPAAGAWGRKGWTHAKLAKVKAPVLGELLREAWRLTAPKRLVAETDAALLSNPKKRR